MVISWRLYAAVKAYWFNWILFQQHWQIGLCSWLTTRYARFSLWLHRTLPDMTSSWSRSPLRPVRYSGDNVKTLNQLSKCCWWRCRSVFLCLRQDDGQNPHFGGAVLPISFTKGVGCILPSRLSQFVELHLLLPKSLHALLDCFGDFAHYAAGFVISAHIALLSRFIIFLFPILPIVGTCKITQTVSDSNQHLLKRLFWLSGRQSRYFSMRHIVLLLLNCGLCIFNSLSCPSSLSLHIILNPLLFLFIA